MDGLRESLLQIADCFYKGENENGVSALMQQAGNLGGVQGVVNYVNPLFDALERADYLFAADIIRLDIAPLID